MDKILLGGARLEVHLGVPEEERRQAQTVVVDLEMDFDIRAAAAADDFRLTVDYAAVHETLRRVASERPYALVECLAERLAAAVLDGFPVRSVRVRVKKPAALASRGVEFAGVEIVRERS